MKSIGVELQPTLHEKALHEKAAALLHALARSHALIRPESPGEPLTAGA